jgi:hypothetical protein
LITTAGAKPVAKEDNQAAEAFGIHIVDEATGRGVPLVELELVNHARYISDSAGWVAFNEPGLMDSRVFFTVRSHGYEFPKDGFGNTGKTLRTVPGGSATLKIKRINIAERLCRLTGGGIYRDSVILGKPVLLKDPVLNGKVFGQDSAVAAIYRGRAYWFWGDTGRPSYPLGNFGTAGATVELPINPADGINYEYFTDKKGFSRPLFSSKKTDAGMVWVGGLAVVPDAEGNERLITHYSVMKGLGDCIENGFAVFNDSTFYFDPVVELPGDKRKDFSGSHPVRIAENGASWILFNSPWPVVRVSARLDALSDPTRYEAFTCLKPAARYAKGENQIARDANGNTVWGWKANTDPVSQEQEKEMITAGLMNQNDARFQLADAAMGEEVLIHAGSVRWNKFRKRWILIGHQKGGVPSNLGEVWYAEADAPTGPWRQAVKIVTHDKYSFYNVVHHDFLDTKDGRLIHFEGTYTKSFSGAKSPTPWYDYNQILYRLDLADPRLKPARE